MDAKEIAQILQAAREKGSVIPDALFEEFREYCKQDGIKELLGTFADEDVPSLVSMVAFQYIMQALGLGYAIGSLRYRSDDLKLDRSAQKKIIIDKILQELQDRKKPS